MFFLNILFYLKVIRKAIASDFGDYNCTVRTTHGEDAFLITLKRESKKTKSGFL